MTHRKWVHSVFFYTIMFVAFVALAVISTGRVSEYFLRLRPVFPASKVYLMDANQESRRQNRRPRRLAQHRNIHRLTAGRWKSLKIGWYSLSGCCCLRLWRCLCRLLTRNLRRWRFALGAGLAPVPDAVLGLDTGLDDCKRHESNEHDCVKENTVNPFSVSHFV